MGLLDLLPFVAVVAVMWLLLIRPARKRQQEQMRLVEALAPGVRVMTTSGMLGTVVSVGAEVDLQVADGVVVTFVPGAIARVVPPAQPPVEPADAGDEQSSAAAGSADGTAVDLTARATSPAAE